MRTEKQIKEKIKSLEGLLTNKELEDEVIMGTKQRMRIRMKIDILKWVLDEEEKKIEGDN